MISLISAYFLVFKRTFLHKLENLFPYPFSFLLPSRGRTETQFEKLFS